MSTRKVVVYIAMSLDGYIARTNDGLDWLDMVARPGEDYGYQDFVNTVDTVIMGRKTYDVVLGFGIPYPHASRKSYVLSRSRTGNDDNVTYYNGSLKELIGNLKQLEGKDIFIDGGADAVNDLLRECLIDRVIVSIIPHLLGDGVRLFQPGIEQQIQLVKSCTFPSGLVQLWYDKVLESK